MIITLINSLSKVFISRTFHTVYISSMDGIAVFHSIMSNLQAFFSLNRPAFQK